MWDGVKTANVIVDEAHLRTVRADYVVAMAILALNGHTDLRFILMSARQALIFKANVRRVRKHFLAEPLAMSVHVVIREPNAHAGENMLPLKASQLLKKFGSIASSHPQGQSLWRDVLQCGA